MEIPGVIRASVGYTGRIGQDLTPATYKSVCDGDGNTEAVRIVFDTTKVSYEKIVQLFFDNPRVPVIYGDQDVQYQIACWAVDDRQMTLAKNAAESAGKGGVPVYDFRCTSWYDGEESHQNFFGSIAGWSGLFKANEMKVVKRV